MALEVLQHPSSQANLLSILETGVTNPRGIVLRGRSLPFEGVGFGTKLNVDVNYFPGNPVASAQVVGAEWDDTTLNGRWSDVFLIDDEHAPSIFGFPDLADQALPESDVGREIQIPTVPTFLRTNNTPAQSGGTLPGGGRARMARTVRDAMYLLCRGGQLLRFEWGSIARFGYIGEFTPTHDREQDIHWEIQMKWTGDTDAQPKPQPRSKDLVSGIKLVIDFWEQVLTFLSSASLFVETYKLQITQFVRKMDSLAADLVSALERMVRISTPATPENLFGNTKAAYRGMVEAIAEFLAQFRQLGAKIKRSRDTNGDPADGIIIDGLQREFRRLAARLAAEAVTQESNVDRYFTPAIQATVRPTSGTTLRDISIDQYGTPNNWRAIQDFNGFPDSVVPAGTTVRVPEIPASPTRGQRQTRTTRVNSLNVAGVI